MKMPREFYMPKSDTLQTVDCAGTDAAVYTYETAGRCYAIAFHGKASKPDWHHRFRSIEERAKHIAAYLEGRKAHAAAMVARKVERQQPHNYKVGDILSSSWGYDQTNVDFYEVIETTARTIVVRQVAQECVGGEGGPSESVVAVPGKYIGEPVTKVVNNGGVKMESWGRYASKWNGQPRHQTGHGWGH